LGTICSGVIRKAPKPKRGYPLALLTIGDHVRKKRLDQGLSRKAHARELRVDPLTLKNWEEGRTRVEVRFYPAIIAFLGYNPLPEPKTLGQAVRRARTAQGIARRALADLAGVDEATIKRLEDDTPRMALRAIRAVCGCLDLPEWISSSKSR